jgi:rSAM/selenodomain-associated transferase 2
MGEKDDRKVVNSGLRRYDGAAWISVVIPALNAAGTLRACLDALSAAVVREIIVVDGGSTDGTVACAAGARVIAAPAERGGQLRAGVAAATGDFLLLLHADTVLAPGWPAAVAGLDTEKAGYFRLRLDSPRRAARVLEWVVARRCRWLGLPYGDQGLFISRALLERVGGVPDLPLMEDVALARRLRGRLMPLAADAVTSAAKYERDGFLGRPLRNLMCLTLYYCGLPIGFIKRLYG